MPCRKLKSSCLNRCYQYKSTPIPPVIPSKLAPCHIGSSLSLTTEPHSTDGRFNPICRPFKEHALKPFIASPARLCCLRGRVVPTLASTLSPRSLRFP